MFTDKKDYFVAEPVVSKANGAVIIHVVRPVVVNGKTEGFFAGVVNLSNINSSIVDIECGETGYAMLINNDGTVIAAYTPEIVMNVNL